jgi:Tol biopolymer transport system component
MPDLRSIVDGELSKIQVRPFAIDAVHERRERKRRNQRIRAGALGIAIAATLLAILAGTTVFRSSSSPAATPTQIPGRHAGGLTYATDAGIVLLHGGSAQGFQGTQGVRAFAWSPDGSELTYMLHPTGPGSDTCSLWTLDVSSGTSRELTACARDPYIVGQPIAWRPDGTLIAYEAAGKIHLVAPDGRDDSVIAHGYSPTWSSDGTQLAYLGTSDKIERYDLTTGDTSSINVEGNRPLAIAWSPDGQEIAILRDVQELHCRCDRGVLQVWLIRPDGSHQTEIARQPRCCLGAIPTMGWSPDSTRIILTGVRFQIIDVATERSRFAHRRGMGLSIRPSWRPIP